MDIGNALVPSPAGGQLALWQDDLDAAKGFILASRSEATRKGYKKDWGLFVRWCEARGVDIDLARAPVPSALAVTYVSSLAKRGCATATIQRHVAAIAYSHRLRDLPSPTNTRELKDCVAGIRRTLGTRSRFRKAAAAADLIHRMLERTPRHTLAGLRDRALISLGFALALRRSELVGLNVEDFSETPQGVFCLIRKSKTDQTAQGQEIPLLFGRHIRPWQAVQDWLGQASIATGPVFRQMRHGDHVLPARLSADAVGTIIKKWAEAAGLNPKDYAGHSLRAGFATEAVECGADPFAITTVTRHRNINTLVAYVRRKDSFKSHPGEGFL